MKLLVTQRHTENEYGDWTDSLENGYIKTFEELGCSLVTVSNVSGNVEQILAAAGFDAILLTGGGDIDAGDSTNTPNQRDKLEYQLLDHAIEHKVPVLGICRGMQSINVYFQGQLLRDIRAIDSDKVHGTPSRHEIKLVDPRIVDALDGKDTFEVNSYHDHAVMTDGLGENLSVFAEFEPLNIVEGLYHQQYPIAALQWHPEREAALTQLDDFILNSFRAGNLFWK